MKSNTFILFGWILLVAACSSAEQQQLEQLQDDVLAVHDEIMPKMGTLNELKTTLIEKNEALKITQDSTVADQVIINDMIITKLDEAHENMMAWMRQFKKIDESANPGENKQYLENQMKSIQEVKVEMDQAILSAQEALKD